MNDLSAPQASPDSDAEFYRQLQQVTTRIHDTGSLNQLMVEVSQDICTLLNADRLTMYVVAEDGRAIISRVKTDQIIYIMDRDGGILRAITSGFGICISPRWYNF